LAFDRPADMTEDGRQGDGYLKRDALTPRPMAYALRDLFQSWKTSGTAQTDAGGQVAFNGFAGEYLITLTGSNGAVREEKIHVREGKTNIFNLTFDENETLIDNKQDADVTLKEVRYAFAWADDLGKTKGLEEANSGYTQALLTYNAGQYWNAIQLAEQALNSLTFQIDGESDDWVGVTPRYTQSDEQAQASGNELRHFWSTMDSSYLYLLFEFNTSTPRRQVLFNLDTGADGVCDYHVHTSPMGSYTIFIRQEYASDVAAAVTHIIPTIDVIYNSTIEVRIPLVNLGNPSSVEIVGYLEDQGDGTITTVIPSLGVVNAFTLCLTWSEVIEKYNEYVNSQATWDEVVECYNQYTSSGS
jgi:hypothetical protein